MIVKIFAFSVSNSVSSNMKVQNAFLTKFKIMKLKIDACSVFMIFLIAVPKNLWIDFFIE